MQRAKHSWSSYLWAVAAVGLAALLLSTLRNRINSTTVALGLLLSVLLVATRFGAKAGVLASLVAMICLNFFFLPPVGTLTIADPQNWVALAAFLITAVTVGQLSARAKRRAQEAEEGRREIERLYKELREAFHRASHAEALRQSERLKSALLDAVTHDLRTPLTSIKASVTTLLDELRVKGAEPVTLDAEDRQEMLEVIDEEADRLNRFIESLVELARIEAGEMRLRRRWVPVEEIVATALDRTRPLTRAHVVEVEIDGDVPIVRVDAQAMAEVVYNLIDNAAKYSPASSKILVSARRGEGDTIRLRVEDEGRGVPPELRERVFDKFFRISRPANLGPNQPPGTGMGLAIAKGIVEAHGGRIWIDDAESSGGTAIIAELPIGDDEAATADDPEPRAQAIAAHNGAADE